MTELEYFGGDELAASVWRSKYALDSEKTPDDMHWRMAEEFTRIEMKYSSREESRGENNPNLSEYGQERKHLYTEEIFELFAHFKWIVPQGSVMSVLGTDKIASLSNCVVIPSPFDSYGGIAYTDSQLANLFKRRCGVGFDISTLRPKDTAVRNSAKTSTGAVSFMERFSNTTREVAQGGRRGALMLTMDCRHPDIMDFVSIKSDTSKVTGANISVMLRDDFMEAVKADEDYILRWPCDTEYKDTAWKDTIEDERHEGLMRIENCYFKRIKAKDLYDKIVENAHANAEPGQIFVDRHWDYSPDGVYPQFKMKSTNPCGEIGMQNDSCRLMALNLFSFVKNPFTDKAEIDYGRLYKMAYEQQRLADDLVDLELEHVQRILDKIDSDPEPNFVKQIERDTWQMLYNSGKAGRRTGCGFTALADMLAALGLKYDSDEAMDVTEDVLRTKMEAEFDCSIDLAILRGPFEDWRRNWEYAEGYDEFGFCPDECGNSFYFELLDLFPDIAHRMWKFGRRNVSLSTVAPTGSLSLLTQTSSGMEPLFQPIHTRRKKVNPGDEGVRVDFIDAQGDSWQEFHVLHSKLKDWMEIYQHPASEGDLHDKGRLDYLLSHSPWYKSTANDIDWLKRVKIQSIIQTYTTHSISSTINLPENATKEEVGEIYMKAWEQGLKGVTVYREGSRDGVLINKKELTQFEDNHAPRRPKDLPCKVIHFQNNYQKWVAFIGLYDNKPYEIFTGLAEAIDMPASIDEGVIRKLKNGGDDKRYDFVYRKGDEELTVHGLSRTFDKEYWNYAKLISGVLRHGMPLEYVIELIRGLTFFEDNINTWKNGVVRSLSKFLKKQSNVKCPNGCETNLVFEEGCQKCPSCGFSKC